MKNLIWSAAAAFGLILGSAGGAKAQYVYQSYYPSTVYAPPATIVPAPMYVPNTGYYPNYYPNTVYTAPPAVSYYTAPTYYYPTYSYYRPYRTWGWYRY